MNIIKHQLANFVIVTLLLFNFSIAFGQSSTTETEVKGANWQNQSYGTEGVMGVETEKAYEYLKGKKSKTVIVAIIDSGMDTTHEDLQGKLWTNPGEIPGNGIDDDHNGYVDDIHGWNFLGNSKGENIEYSRLEVTRLYHAYYQEFRDKTIKEIPEGKKEDFKKWEIIKADFAKQLQDKTDEKTNFESFKKSCGIAKSTMEKYFNRDDYTIEDVKNINSDNEFLKACKNLAVYMMENNITDEYFETVDRSYVQNFSYRLNPNYSDRDIIGDNLDDINDSLYGNPNINAGTPSHGTSVAGVVAAIRDNGIGMDGVAENVQLMIIRVVPNGDEWDKDVALGIRYAVKNGAQIINCSFGKSYSPNKKFVDDAVEFAEQNNVLIIHAAGNDGENNDVKEHYPSNRLNNGKIAANWITVGASTMTYDKNLVGSFSNYGKKSVDVFAPGVRIYTCKPGNGYEKSDGTSVASPVVTGVAALLKSYYPSLTAVELKKIILDSSTKPGKMKVILPNEDSSKKAKKVKFNTLSVSGGVVDALEAVKMAEKFTNK